MFIIHLMTLHFMTPSGVLIADKLSLLHLLKRTQSTAWPPHLADGG